MEQKTNETRHLRLPDGRRLAYAEYGDPRGVPVIYCHGFPGSRLEAKLFESSMQHSGVRLIAPDRNGLGESDPLPGRRLLDWPAEVAALADALGLERFHLLGVSGGGPYALACAHSLSERLIGVSLVCPLGPLNHPGLLRMMQWPAVFSFTAMRLMPLLTRPLYRHTLVPMAAHHPQWLYRLMLGMLPPPDYRVLASAQVRAVIIASLAESVRQGGAGVLRELELYVAPWGCLPRKRSPSPCSSGTAARTKSYRSCTVGRSRNAYHTARPAMSRARVTFLYPSDTWSASWRRSSSARLDFSTGRSGRLYLTPHRAVPPIGAAP